jgi:hypothetical protein
MGFVSLAQRRLMALCEQETGPVVTSRLPGAYQVRSAAYHEPLPHLYQP